MVFSATHTLSTRENLRQAHERQQEKSMREEEYGSCRNCEADFLELTSCKECVNGGGKKKLFRSKSKKRKMNKSS